MNAKHSINAESKARDVASAGASDGAAFEIEENDPRHTENRGGLEATLPTPEGASAPPADRDERDASDAGTTGADMNSPRSGGNHDTGAGGTAHAGSGQLNMGTTGMAAPDAAPPGAGPVEGSQSGAVAPRVEMTDVGLVDLNETDLGTLGEPTAGEDDVNARVNA